MILTRKLPVTVSRRATFWMVILFLPTSATDLVNHAERGPRQGEHRCIYAALCRRGCLFYNQAGIAG